MDLSLSPTPKTKWDLTTNNPWDSHRLALFAPPRMWKITKHHPVLSNTSKIFEVTATLHVDSIFRVLQNKLFELFTLFWAPVQQMVQTYSWWLQCLDFCPNFWVRTLMREPDAWRKFHHSHARGEEIKLTGCHLFRRLFLPKRCRFFVIPGSCPHKQPASWIPQVSSEYHQGVILNYQTKLHALILRGQIPLKEKLPATF